MSDTAPASSPQEAGTPAAAIERLLRERLRPQQLELRDDSAAHAGHPGSGGKGHFRVRIVSTSFDGLTALQRHRLINGILAPLWRKDLHAVSITALTPSESIK